MKHCFIKKSCCKAMYLGWVRHMISYQGSNILWIAPALGVHVFIHFVVDGDDDGAVNLEAEVKEVVIAVGNLVELERVHEKEALS